MLRCDGCGIDADALHIRQRIERLELATRFRPVHIQVLLIDDAPPARLEDYFYRADAGDTPRSAASARYCEELLQCAGMAPNPGGLDESVLSEFQRRGFFLVYAMECPVENGNCEEAFRSRSETILTRVRYSYRPKKIALLSRTGLLAAPLEGGGFGNGLILDDGQAFGGVCFGKRVSGAVSVAG